LLDRAATTRLVATTARRARPNRRCARMPQMLHGSDDTDDSDDSEHQKFSFPLAIASVAAALAGMGLLGWFGGPWNLIVALVIVEVGAIAAGWVEARLKGSGLRSRLVASLTWSIFGVTCAAATMWYAEGRSSMWNVELLIPLAIGLVPLGAIRLAFWLVTRNRAADARAPQPRSPVGVVEVALAALVLAVPVAGWAFASKTFPAIQAKAEKAEHDATFRALIFEADGHGGVTYEGHAVDRDAIAKICRQAAASDPEITVVLRTPKEIDNVALGKIGFGAQSAHLTFNALPIE
jgi:cytochrome b561